MTKKCAFCGKNVYPREKEGWRGGERYIHEFINVSREISLVFCTKKHKDEFINQFLRKPKSLFFLPLFDINKKKY